MSFITNALAGAGSGYASAQNAQNAQVGQLGANLANQLAPYMSAAYNNTAALEPQRQATIAQSLYNLAPGNQAAQEQAYGNQAFSNAARAATQAQQQDASQGLSGAYQAGESTAANQSAANQANQYNAYINSPEYQLGQATSRLQLYGAAQSNPYASGFQQAVGTAYGEPRVQVQPGLGSALGSIAGDALGGALGGSSLGGGGGGVNVGSTYQPDTGYGPGSTPSFNTGNAYSMGQAF